MTPLAAAIASASSEEGSLWPAQSISMYVPTWDARTGCSTSRCSATRSIAAGSITSTASSDDTDFRSWPSSSTAAPMLATDTKAVIVWSYLGTSLRRAEVTIAAVPSEPASTDGQFNPTVSFGNPESDPTTSPFPRTASIPKTCCRIVP